MNSSAGSSLSSLEELLLIAGMMVVTFGVRYPVLAFTGRFTLPLALQRALKYVPVAVLSAIAVPMALKPEGSLNLALDNAHLVAAVVAVAAAYFGRQLLVTILVGMIVFVTLQII